MAISGFPDILPHYQGLYNQWLKSIEKVFQNFGFSPMEEIVVESLKVLTAKGNDHEIYTLGRLHQEGSNKDLALRFDLTIPMARYIKDYKGLLQFPYSRYAIGPVFRGERPQEGRYRQFTQCDVDIVGHHSLSIFYDGYALWSLFSALKALDFQDVLGPVLCSLNHKVVLEFWLSLGQLEGDSKSLALRLMDKKGKLPWEDLRRDIAALGTTEKAMNLLDFWAQKDFWSWEDFFHHFVPFVEQEQSFLKIFEESPSFLSRLEDFKKTFLFLQSWDAGSSFVVSPLLARGLTYYSGILGEFILPDYPHYGSIGGGGRYDNLVTLLEDEKKSKDSYPGVGFSIGLTRLFFTYIKEKEKQEASFLGGEKFPGKSQKLYGKAQVLLILDGEDSLEFFQNLFKTYGHWGLSTFFYLENKSLSHGLRYGSRENIPWVVFANKEERQEGLLVLRYLPTGEQKKISLEESINYIQQGFFS